MRALGGNPFVPSEPTFTQRCSSGAALTGGAQGRHKLEFPPDPLGGHPASTPAQAQYGSSAQPPGLLSSRVKCGSNQQLNLEAGASCGPLLGGQKGPQGQSRVCAKVNVEPEPCVPRSWEREDTGSRGPGPQRRAFSFPKRPRPALALPAVMTHRWESRQRPSRPWAPAHGDLTSATRTNSQLPACSR